MPKPYSTDLRERALEAVESGASRREVAEIFRVGVSSVIRWCQSWSETGSVASKRSSGSVSPLEEHSDRIPDSGFESHRPAGVYRRERHQHKHGAAQRPLPTRRTTGRVGSTWTLENDHLRCRLAP